MTQYLIFSAIVPSVLLIWYFYHRDRNPEPQKIIWATFGLGVLTVFPVLLVDAPISKLVEQITNPYVRSAGEAFLVAGFPEEFFKYLVVVLFVMRRRAFDEPMDGIVYGAVASLGFATFENILYVSEGGFGLALIRALTAVPGHACFGAIMGYFVGQYKFGSKKRPVFLLAAYLVPVLLHGLYDFPLITLSSVKNLGEENPGLAALLVMTTLTALIFSIVTAVRLGRKLRRQQDEQAHLAQLKAAELLASGLMNPSLSLPSTSLGLEQVPIYHSTPASGFMTQTVSVAVSVPMAPPMKNRFLSWIFLLMGAGLGTLSSIFVLAVSANISQGETKWTDGTLAIVIFGLPFLLAGTFLFRYGLHRLRPARKVSAILPSLSVGSAQTA